MIINNNHQLQPVISPSIQTKTHCYLTDTLQIWYSELDIDLAVACSVSIDFQVVVVVKVVKEPADCNVTPVWTNDMTVQQKKS